MQLESQKKSLILSNYTISFVPNESYLSVCNLDVGENIRLLCRISLQDHFLSKADIEIKINSLDNKIKSENGLYAGRLRKILLAVVDLSHFEKTKMTVEIDILQKKVSYDIYHHLVNLVSISLLLANVDMKMFFVTSTCFIGGSNEVIGENEVDQTNIAKYSQAFLCKDCANNEQIVSFKIHGNIKNNSQMGEIFAFLIASGNVMGNKLIEYFGNLDQRIK